VVLALTPILENLHCKETKSFIMEAEHLEKTSMEGKPSLLIINVTAKLGSKPTHEVNLHG